MLNHHPMFSILSRNLMIFLPGAALCRSRPLSIRHLSIDASSLLITSLIKKYLLFTCLVRLELEYLPLISNNITLVLSWWIKFSVTVSIRNGKIHRLVQKKSKSLLIHSTVKLQLLWSNKWHNHRRSTSYLPHIHRQRRYNVSLDQLQELSDCTRQRQEKDHSTIQTCNV